MASRNVLHLIYFLAHHAVRFTDYTVHNYIEATSRYPPAIWLEPSLDVKRTTNGCEAFHQQFSDMFYNHHPNIYDFMEKIKLIQTYNYLKTGE